MNGEATPLEASAVTKVQPGEGVVQHEGIVAANVSVVGVVRALQGVTTVCVAALPEAHVVV